VIVSAPSVLPYILSVPSEAVYTGNQLINNVIVSVWEIPSLGEKDSYFFNNATGQLVRIVIGNSNDFTQIDYLSMTVGPISKSDFSIPKGVNCSKAVVGGRMLTKVQLEKYLDIKPKLAEINPAKASADLITPANRTSVSRAIDPATVIMIGEKVWQIIVDNKPVANINTKSNGVVPQGSGFPDLAGWQQFSWKPWKWEWNNLYGASVVNFEWSFDWQCQGNYRGIGQYIENAGAFPKALNVAWGYTVSVDAQMLQPTNMGTHESPVAAVTFYLTMKINTVLKATSQSCKVVLQGDCGSILLFCDQYS